MRRRIITSLALAVFVGCGNPGGPGDGLQGGALATFQVSGEQFRVWVKNPPRLFRCTAPDEPGLSVHGTRDFMGLNR